MKTKRFQRCIEEFECEVCKTRISGDGYTNHCPKCLWSKHVDHSPGDRASTCGGLMEPVALALSAGEYIITHRCTKCSHQKRNRASKLDHPESLVELSTKNV